VLVLRLLRKRLSDRRDEIQLAAAAETALEKQRNRGSVTAVSPVKS